MQQIEKFNSTVNVSVQNVPQKFSPSMLAVLASFKDSGRVSAFRERGYEAMILSKDKSTDIGNNGARVKTK